MNRNRLYWQFQLSGWFIWALNEALLYTNQYGWKWAWIFSSIINIIVAICLTHAYRKISQKYRWQDLPLITLIQVNLIALVFMSACLLALNIPLDYIFLSENYTVLLSPFIILQIFLNFAKPMAIWQLIYFFFQYSNKKLDMERENDQLERTILETEGQVLRAQMNPHFVFNALNSVRALITEDPQKAKKGISQLSKLLRSSLLTERKKTISLSEELETISDYLSLEKIRYEDRLTWEITLDKDCQKAQIPPMLLQTLVENAIKHGMSKKITGGIIAIDAKNKQGVLTLSVINSGNLKGQLISKEQGVGLINSKKRLQILFGETAQISLKPLDKNHVIAEVKIPYLEN
jgi:two-component system LytT family sensor kinase